METIDPTTLLPLHPLEFRILLVLLEGASHGYRIVRAIEERERGISRIYPANLYRRIRDLQQKGLVEESAPPRGAGVDARRTYVRVTSLGRRVARLEAERLEVLVMEAREHRLLAEGGR